MIQQGFEPLLKLNGYLTVICPPSTHERFAEALHIKDYFLALKTDGKFHQIVVDNSNIHSMVASLRAHVKQLFFITPSS
ncbi:hypothetical protein [Sporosarcina sp. NPDC096371]|uniref:hypothetical protein n=1 Tax=Sporosarcina sp. NPDC096371 TaxID=3364530 RepID=UPI0037F151E5